MKPIRLLLLALLFPVAAHSQSPALTAWKNDKYSMFIHWGVYSVLGGVWEGKPVTRGYSEQIRAHAAGLYSDTYERVAKTFNPVQWNPDSVALLAKAAGMRSIVLTSKHHDGFCMFKSAYTTFNMVDATPYKRDVVKELSEACQRAGLRFGLYFSLIDWHFPGAYPISSSNSDPIPDSHHEYNKNQVTELLTHYGPISELWFDMGSLTAKQSTELRDLVHRLQPDCMVSGRLGNEAGDFCVMGDNEYPNYKIATPWQTPASIYDETWGYRSWQEHGLASDKAREKLVALLKVVSRGGNYLLNIGPRGDGTVVDFERDVLLRNGEWLRKNGEAVYAASPNPFPEAFEWGEVTTKGNKLYLAVTTLPKTRSVLLPHVTGQVKNIYLLGSPGASASYQRQGNGLKIMLPGEIKSVRDIPVIVVDFQNGYSVPAANLETVYKSQRPKVLDQRNAEPHYSIGGIDYNTYFRGTVSQSWTVQSPAAVNCKPVLVYTEEEKGKSIDFSIDGNTETVVLDGDPSVRLPQNGPIFWGSTYTHPVQYSGIAWPGVTGMIEPSKPWPGTTDPAWRATNWKHADEHELPAEPSQSWFILQEMTADKARQVLVEIRSGDGLAVWLNGEELLVRNSPEKAETNRNVVLLPLKSGRNQLVVKLFNQYHDKVPVLISDDIPQLIYRKELTPVKWAKESGHTIELKLANPPSPHRILGLPNLSVELGTR